MPKLTTPIAVTQAVAYDVDMLSLDLTSLTVTVSIKLRDASGGVVSDQSATLSFTDVLKSLGVTPQQVQDAIVTQLKKTGVVN